MAETVDIPKTLQEYIDALAQDKDKSERLYNQRKAYLNRAQAANGKSKLIENTLKDYKERIETTDDIVKNLSDAAFRAAALGHKITENTDISVNSLKNLSYEVSDVSKKTEVLLKQVEIYRDEAKKRCGEKSPIIGCAETVLNTISPAIDTSLDALEKTLAVLKTAELLSESLSGNCGVVSRLVGVMVMVEACEFPLKTASSDTEPDCPECMEKEAIQRTELKNKYKCEIPPASAATPDEYCDCEYKAYLKYVGLDKPCDQYTNANAMKYYKSILLGYENAVKRSVAAQNWLNCTSEAKNTAESQYNAFKAAYDAANEAKKC
jgi:hypothetical protein